MITYIVGDILKSPARVLVNTVNTVGVMGTGIAADFKKIYPEMFKQYQILCEKKQFDVGQLWLYKTKHKWILNFPTKKHWKGSSKIDYIRLGLEKFVSTYADKGITSISFPMLGCGNGGLDWEQEVRPLMEQYLKNLPIDIYIHLYRKDPFETEQCNIAKIKKWLRSEPESLPFTEVWEDIEELLSKDMNYFTLDHNLQFTARVINDPEKGIQIKSREESFNIYMDQLLELWQHIRSLGFYIESSLPNILDKHSPYLISILQKLPYLKPVLISTKYQNIDNNDSIGLQLIPNSLKDTIFSNHRDIFEVNLYE